MADLITHACVAVLFKALTGGSRVRTFVAGTLLPDVMARVPALALGLLNRHVDGLPDIVRSMWMPLHLPVGMVPAAYVLSLLFPEEERLEGFYALLGGMFLHLAVDLLQRHYTPGYRIFFPLWSQGLELGLIGSEDSVWAAPILVVLAAAAWWWRSRRAAAP